MRAETRAGLHAKRPMLTETGMCRHISDIPNNNSHGSRYTDRLPPDGRRVGVRFPGEMSSLHVIQTEAHPAFTPGGKVT
jgi:hypothetical protein